MSLPPDIQAIFDWCVKYDGVFPYVYGGGGDALFLPTNGGKAGGPVGYDCSKGLSAAVHAGNPAEMPLPLGTHELAAWGLEGFGDNLTIRVVNGLVNGIPTEHCLLEFPKAPASQRYFMAHFTGGPNMGFVPEDGFNPSVYAARRKVEG